MTPAEKPNEIDKNFVLVLFVKNANKPPIPVDKPAKEVNNTAIQKLDNSIIKVSSIQLFINLFMDYLILGICLMGKLIIDLFYKVKFYIFVGLAPFSSVFVF